MSIYPMCNYKWLVHDYVTPEYEADWHWCVRPIEHTGMHICHCGTNAK